MNGIPQRLTYLYSINSSIIICSQNRRGTRVEKFQRSLETISENIQSKHERKISQLYVFFIYFSFLKHSNRIKYKKKW